MGHVWPTNGLLRFWNYWTEGKLGDDSSTSGGVPGPEPNATRALVK